jgi:hypothetical protein
MATAIALPDGAEAAATLTLGSTLPMTGAGHACRCTLLQTVGARSADAFVAPVDGVITRWRTRNVSGEPGPTPLRGFALRVLRPNGGSSYTGLATSEYVMPMGENIEVFATSLPVSAGQYVGLDDPEGMFIGSEEGGGSWASVSPPLAEGSTASFAPEHPGELTYNFDLLPTPTVTAVTAAAGAATGETDVGIAGTSFEEVEAVTFGGTPFERIVIGGSPAASYEVRSEHLITAVAPAGLASGSVPVRVTTAAGVASASFDYTAPPSPSTVGGQQAPTSTPALTPRPTCQVPKLRDRSLKASKKRVHAADCKLGKVTKRRGATARTGRVVRQTPRPGASVPAGTRVKVTLGPK